MTQRYGLYSNITVTFDASPIQCDSTGAGNPLCPHLKQHYRYIHTGIGRPPVPVTVSHRETPVSFITAELSSLKYVDICLCDDDSRDVKCVSALCDSGAEICVVNSSVVEGLNLDFIGQVQLRPFCGNTVTADLVCLNVSLADSDVPSITPNHVVKVTCVVVPDLHDKFILTADVIDRLSRCKTNTSITVSQAQVNDVNSPVLVDSVTRNRKHRRAAAIPAACARNP